MLGPRLGRMLWGMWKSARDPESRPSFPRSGAFEAVPEQAFRGDLKNLETVG
jgi:hypothetical protein